MGDPWITLTFDYSKSSRHVEHTVESYDFSAPSVPLSLGWNHKSFATACGVTNTTIHTESGEDIIHFDSLLYHHEESVTGVSPAVALSHSPTPNHFDLWRDTSDPNKLYLRVGASIPPPPIWSKYVKPAYSESTFANYVIDRTAFDNAFVDGWLNSWYFKDGSSKIIHRSNATIKDGDGLFGKIHASEPINPTNFLSLDIFRAVVKGSGRDDTIMGYALDDVLYGRGGDDELWGGGDDDRLYGGTDRDKILGERDGDHLWGGLERDQIDGGRGGDHLYGGGGLDFLVGGDGSDIIFGGGDGDSLYGSDGIDELNGGAGIDVLNGGEEDDTLRGQGNNDHLDGREGSDDLFGGVGRDMFVFKHLDGIDVVEDFKHGVDKILLSQRAFPRIDEWNSNAFHAGPRAGDVLDRIIYSHGILYYDPDGSKNGGLGAAQVAFANVANDAALSYSDFQLIV